MISWIMKNPAKAVGIWILAGLVLGALSLIGFATGVLKFDSKFDRPRSAQVAQPARASAETGKSYTVAEFDAKLTGKWTISNDIASSCSQNGAFFVRQADGTMEITGDDGQVINTSTWKMEKVYDENLGAIRIEHPGRAPIYWVVRFQGHDMKTSIMLDRPPEGKSAALADLAKLDPKYPDIKLPMMHRCDH